MNRTRLTAVIVMPAAVFDISASGAITTAEIGG
jgi:hypothetical protein